MKVLGIIIVYILAALSILAGGAKILRMPQELEFLQGFGLSTAVIVMFGVAQLVGGILLLPTKTRLFGAVVVAVGFLVSAVLVFISGNLSFGLVSLVPTVFAVFAIQQSVKATHN